MRYTGGGEFTTDRSADAPMSDAAVRALSNTAGQELTFTCVPPGSGLRIGIDRDEDGFGDADELDHGSDPANAASIPSGVPPVCTSTTSFVFRRATLRDSRGTLSMLAKDVPLTTYTQQSVSMHLVDGGGTIFSGVVPGASIVPKGSGFKFHAVPGSTGITYVTVRESRSMPGRFRVTMRTKAAWAPGLANETELTTDVTLNIGGRCFQGNATKVRP